MQLQEYNPVFFHVGEIQNFANERPSYFTTYLSNTVVVSRLKPEESRPLGNLKVHVQEIIQYV
jgi:hypothetical protein